ncbi:hypothetical protein VTH82DRAFT_1627 [Thermothelomyces myriococcoides]
MWNRRCGGPADLRAITNILIAASPDDPLYQYRFPDRNRYPAEFEAFCRQKCLEYLNDSVVQVYEQPTHGVVAFSVWEIPQAAWPAASQPPGALPSAAIPYLSFYTEFVRSTATIGNQARKSEFRKALSEAKKKLNAYYGDHVFLRILMTHPDHRRRGAGTELTKWGIDLAKRLGVPTTLFASPMGLKLYEKLGFHEIGKCHVQVDGDPESLTLPAMVKFPA